jgi:hypothetical protein
VSAAELALDVGASIDLLGATALRIRDERDELKEILRDLVHGADLMLQPSMQLTGSFLAYVREVRRVAKSGVSV